MNITRISIWTRTGVLFLLALLPTAARAADLSASIKAASLEVANVTRGGDVVVMTVQREAYRGGQREFSTALMVRDTDRDGRVEFLPGRKTPNRSIWIIVDVATGEYVLTGGYGYQRRILAAPKHLLKEEADGIAGFVGRDVLRSQMLVVRPGQGAWYVAAWDGSPVDADREKNGQVTLGSEDTVAVGGKEKGPKRLKKGDIVAVIDPDQLEVFVLEIEK